MKQLLLLLACITFTLSAWSRQKVEVATVEEFLAAIASDVTIVMKPGDYHLSKYSHKSGEHYRYEDTFDGPELVISNIQGLTIEGEGTFKAHLIANPRYGYVIRFENSQDIDLINLKAGHGPEYGYCTGGVFGFRYCQDIRVDNCLLYGSGTEGVTLENVQDFSATKTLIKSCTYSIMTIDNAQDVTFNRCRFFDNKEFGLVNIHNSADIDFKKCKFRNNHTNYEFFQVFSAEDVRLASCNFMDNTSKHLCNDRDALKLKKTNLRGNSFSGGLYPPAGH